MRIRGSLLGSYKSPVLRWPTLPVKTLFERRRNQAAKRGTSLSATIRAPRARDQVQPGDSHKEEYIGMASQTLLRGYRRLFYREAGERGGRQRQKERISAAWRNKLVAFFLTSKLCYQNSGLWALKALTDSGYGGVDIASASRPTPCGMPDAAIKGVKGRWRSKSEIQALISY